MCNKEDKFIFTFLIERLLYFPNIICYYMFAGKRSLWFANKNVIPDENSTLFRLFC